MKYLYYSIKTEAKSFLLSLLSYSFFHGSVQNSESEHRIMRYPNNLEFELDIHEKTDKRIVYDVLRKGIVVGHIYLESPYQTSLKQRLIMTNNIREKQPTKTNESLLEKAGDFADEGLF